MRLGGMEGYMSTVPAGYSEGRGAEERFLSSVSTFSSSVDEGGRDDDEPFCKWILYWEIEQSRVRVWDVLILVPTSAFLLFLSFRLERARHKLRATSSAIFCTFYTLVIVNTVVSVVRCGVSMTVNAATAFGSEADKVLWVILRFFLLSTELSVVIFGLAFGHLDSRTSIQRVLLFTSLLSLTYSVGQGALEMATPTDDSFHVPRKNYDIFSHGGVVFWFTTSLVFGTLYALIFSLPWTRLRDRLPLPTKRSFYGYVFFLMLLNLIQATGSGLLLSRNVFGLCVVDVTTYIYFTFFTPLVYHTFLSDFFSVGQPSIAFSYKAQVDEGCVEGAMGGGGGGGGAPVTDDDLSSLPHQLSCSSLKTDSDFIYQNNLLYDSTQFEGVSSSVSSFSPGGGGGGGGAMSPALRVMTSSAAMLPHSHSLSGGGEEGGLKGHVRASMTKSTSFAAAKEDKQSRLVLI